MSLTYTSYLKVNELLNLQQVQSDPPEHDELLFIVIHQTYELWFKLLLHELDRACDALSDGDLYAAIATFQRMRTVMKTLVGQLDILETMTPMSFASFRERLDSSSGFQSTQFREVEFVLGFKRAQMMKYYEHDEKGFARIHSRLVAPSIVDHFYRFLAHRGISLPQEIAERNIEDSTQPNQEIQDAIHLLYQTQPEVSILFELMIDLDEGQQEWRYRHIKLVERTIGNKTGTGGSLGVEFLKKTLFQPIFPDLWGVRHRL